MKSNSILNSKDNLLFYRHESKSFLLFGQLNAKNIIPLFKFTCSKICKLEPHLQKALPAVSLEEHLLSSSVFHKGTWTVSILHNTGASHITRKDFIMLVSTVKFQLFKPSVPLDFLVQTNPIQSHSCLFSCLHIFILADSCTSMPTTKYQSLTHFPYSPGPSLNLRH